MLLLLSSLAVLFYSLFNLQDLSSNSTWATDVSLILIAWLVIYIICMFRHYKTVYLFSSAFLVTLGIFHLGIIVPCGLGLVEVAGWSQGVHSMWNEKAGWLTLISISCIGIGIGFSMILKRSGGNDLSVTVNEDDFRKGLFTDGIGLFLASMVFLGMAIHTFGNLFAHARVDFFRLNAGDTRGFGLLTYVFPTAITLLIIGSRTLGQKLSMYSLGFISFFIIFLSGNRSNALEPLLAGLVLWRMSGRKISLSFSLIILALVLIGIPTIGALRNTGKAYNKMNAEDLVKSADNAKIKQTFLELGQTGILLGDVLKFVPESDPYWYGRTYLHALRAAVPNIMLKQAESFRLEAKQAAFTDPNAIRNIFPSDWLTFRVARGKFLRGEGVGFTGIGEPYMNFGLMGVIVFFLLLGYALGHYDGMDLRSSSNKFAIASVVFWPLLNLPRNDTVIVIKPIVFTLITLLCWRVVTRPFLSRDKAPLSMTAEGGRGDYKTSYLQ